MHVTQILGECSVSAGCCSMLVCSSFAQDSAFYNSELTHILRPPTVFEVISDLWNSSAFNPVAPASECHFDFQEATNCSYDLVAGLTPATPQRIEDIFSSMRSDLIRIISRWEQSGQGEGGRDQECDASQEEDDDGYSSTDADDEEEAIGANGDNASFMTSQTSPASAHDATFPRRHRSNIGTLRGRPARALQSRAAFLNGRPSYLLYFWEVADAHQLLQSSLQRLNNNTGASDASHAPSATSGGSRERQGRRPEAPPSADSQTQQQSLGAIARSITDLAESNRQSNSALIHDRAVDRNHEQQLEEKRQAFEERKILLASTSEKELEEKRQAFEERKILEECRKRCFDRRAQLSDLARQYRGNIAQLNPRDSNGKRLREFYESEVRLVQDEIKEVDKEIDRTYGSK
jgi:hypothetical protein